MSTHRSPSSRPPLRHAHFVRRTGFGRVDSARIPALLYDVMLLFLVILALVHHVLGLGFSLAAFVVWRSIGRRYARHRLTAATAGRPRCERR